MNTATETPLFAPSHPAVGIVMETKKLDHEQKHLMRLCARGKKEDGWAPVSKVVWPLLVGIPTELVEREQFANGAGRAKLTTAGETVLFWS